MKIPLLRYDLLCAVFGAILLCSTPLFADNGTDDGAALKQAEDLVKQAWNLGGDTPSVADRTQWLTKALDLLKAEPDHHLHGTKMKAMALINTALDELKAGDPGNLVPGNLRDADSELRQAIQNAESH
jgi:hypothetical protein